MNVVILGVVLIIWIVILCITPFIIPSYIEYHRIYEQVQESYGLTNFQLFWWSLRDAFCDVFNIDPVDEEADQ
jgi:hypothetical protein